MPSMLSPKPRTPKTTLQSNREASPSYFGLSVDGHNNSVTSSGARVVKGPLSSSIRSSATSPSQTLPFHTNNPEYDAFRQEIERKRSDVSQQNASEPSSRNKRSDKINEGSSSAHVRKSSLVVPTSPRARSMSTVKSKLDNNKDEQEVIARSPKRLLSEDTATFPNQIRRESPAPFRADTALRTGSPPPDRKNESIVLSLPGQRSMSRLDDAKVPSLPRDAGAQTLPEKLEHETPSMVTAQRVVNLLEPHSDDVLLLDLRVVTQYNRSKIRGALNLCVPTTLLKRTSYNTAKLADTFKDNREKARFSSWKTCRYIVVYDANCSQMKEATLCLNLLKKFEAEGWSGDSHIIKGGFEEFASKFPEHVDTTPRDAKEAGLPNLTLKTDGVTSIPPVIGGCPMPASKSAANPFFGNIRQNMDLIGGVGQIPIKLPPTASKDQRGRLPKWLQQACDERDNGKSVADKFYRIEKREQKRMQEALSGNVVYGTPGVTMTARVQIAGLEKGAKNRYNNIWPFEHSRVKIERPAKHECDYVNANFVSSSLSTKRYIATQGPIPATFEDFWRLVWQQDVRVIVMLTAEKEGGQIKAHNYWEDRYHGSMKLRFLSEHRASLEPGKIRQHRERPQGERKHSNGIASTLSTSSSSTSSSPVQSRRSRNSSGEILQAQCDEQSTTNLDAPFVVVRKFTLADSTQPFERMREITQLHYPNWPDFGAPAHPAHLLGLVDQCEAVIRAFSGSQDKNRPMVVHCSAGCGRTGTFCTVDTVIDALRKRRQTRNSASNSQPGIGHSKPTTPMELDRSQDNPFFSPASSSPTQNGPGSHDEDIDLVEKVVEEFRLKRISMVQSLRQFVLCYESILEWLISQDMVG